ncbi:phosphonate C-P lyase system protein PhnG [Roseobacter sp. N2S]|uniref:phosphonate C-P lyase system protein PhnG n=1 Tax=Roseobacter sp. N2S TaxID=2663844 RepID=UPI00285ABAD5|nr:phosphonate C-P lyase system protein PhnG [Roseobacter sp. N2S]MDR6263531.1 alpha-D-ribose 1-methylphosphonate 5-triphosphate synthase subunit PhnG [Roseobacter sp. N2S]
MDDQTRRKNWLGLLAKSCPNTVNQLCENLAEARSYDWLRQPEVGGVMVRGRMGGTGSAFNMGEITVTRCSLRLPDGVVGHGYVQGRDKTHATNAALVDALMQTDRADQIDSDVLQPLRQKRAQQQAAIQARANATKVDFFTMVRGDD